MDPVEVLNAEPFEWMIRVAAHNRIARDRERANEKARKNK